jgi:hypothetical protein
MELSEIVADFSHAFKTVDSQAPQGRSRARTYQPGIGPLTEAEAIKQALPVLRQIRDGFYLHSGSKQYPGERQRCDLVIPDFWAIEFKLIRPYGDNGNEAEHWSENILHPYPGNISSIGDCFKLWHSGFSERKAIVIFGYEHTRPLISLELASRSFEAVATNVCKIVLSERYSAAFDGLIHPIHQQGWVYGWELLNITT